MDSPFSDKLESLLGNEQMMSKIRSLASEMASGGAPPSPDEQKPPERRPAPPPPPPSKVGGYCAILSAIKPYLDPRRRERIDKAIRILRLAETAKTFIGM